ncbi:MAG TPA: hypothetical protein VMS76_15260 [Planctomycetota bacterium]|nr:hypothetical protein [Planctomycetota bacterium]
MLRIHEMQAVEHMASDELVLWGWEPGEGRAPVPTPHPELVRVLRAERAAREGPPPAGHARRVRPQAEMFSDRSG